MKIEIPQFDSLFVIEDFLDWLAEVEKFFDYWETEEHVKVKLVAYRLKGGALAWWDQLQTTRIRQGKNRVRTWRRMKQLMKEHFLLPDYEQTLFSRYQHCRQAYRTISEYVTEFHKLAAHVDIRESENQKISRFVDGHHANIQDEVFKQPHSTLSSAIQLALKIEAQLNKKGNRNPTSSSMPPQRSDWNKGKVVTRPQVEAPKPNPPQRQPATLPQKTQPTSPVPAIRMQFPGVTSAIVADRLVTTPTSVDKTSQST